MKMKKLIISAAIVCAAVVAQAASFNWSDGTRIFGVTPGSVLDNGSYAMGSGSANRMDKMSLTYTLQLLDVSTDALVGSATGPVVDDKGKMNLMGVDIAAAAQNTTYKYVVTLTGTQSSLTGKGSAVDGGDGYDYDYTGATLTTTMNGTITTAVMGATEFPDAVPSTWTVSGITKTAQSGGGSGVPEPTSGLLLALGGAMLALRRRRA